MIFHFCGIFLSLICFVNCARILGIFHIPAYNHFQLGDPILRELASRGHEVTVVTPFPPITPIKNLKHVVLSGFQEKTDDLKKDVFTNSGNGIFSQLMLYDAMGYYFTEAALNHTNVQKLINSEEKFDLVIYENFANEAFAGFAAYYGVPNIVINPHRASRRTNPSMGNPHIPAYDPDIYLGYSKNMNLIQRTLNTLLYELVVLFKHVYSLPNQNKLVQKYFPNAPKMIKMYYNTSLMLLTSHVTTTNPFPLVPNMVEIGGYHIQPPKPLPKDLKDYLDSAKEGVVVFSMGSTLQSKDLPQEKRNDILKALGKLKQKVLWKWEDDTLPGKPSNVKVEKWLPQQDILAHPNVKLFITHGGLLSTTEAIYFGVPIIGIPVIGDQELNIVSAEDEGYGISVPFRDLNEATLSSALNEILSNYKYSENAKHMSKIMHDQPTKPLDTAIYWIEYVLRHNGAPHLRSAALNLHCLQLLLLDVIVILVICVVIIVWGFNKLIKVVCRRKGKIIYNQNKKRN